MEKYLVWIIKLSISGLLITPLLVSPQTIFPFVVGKALWFRSLVIIATTAFLVLKIKYKKDKTYISPVIIILIGFLIINLIASLIGNSFTRSFWGTWERMEGIITILYLLLMIFVTSNTLKSFDEWRKLFQINLIIGFFVAFIALSQLIGLPFTFLDFLPITIMYAPLNESYPGFANNPINPKINGTLANPSFLAQYLSIIVFIGLGFLFEKTILIYKNIKNSKIKFSQTKNELLLFFLISFGVIASLLAILMTGTRSAILGLVVAGLVVTPFIILKINKRSLKYALLLLFSSSLIISFFTFLYLTIVIDWSQDKYRNKILEENLPPSIIERIKVKPSDYSHHNITNSFFNENKFYKYGKITQNVTLDEAGTNSMLLYEASRDDSAYFPLLKSTIDQLITQVDNKEYLDDCDKQLIALDEIIIWYHPQEFFMPNANSPMKDYYYELPSGKRIHPYHRIGQGFTYSSCSPIHKFLDNIHPSLSYIINEGINLRHRKTTYRMSLDAFKEKPVLGFGTESFPYIFYTYLNGTDFNGYTPAKWDRVHSRPLDVLSSTGILGFSIWILIGLWISKTIIRNFKQQNQTEISIFVGGALTAFFIGNILLFPTISTYIQSSLLISFLARSQIGFHEKGKILQETKWKNFPLNLDLITLILISIVSFYFLIIIPYSAVKNQTPQNMNTDLETFSENLSSFSQMAILGRTNLVYLVLNDWNAILNSSPQKEQIILKIISVIEKNAEDSFKKDPNNFELNLAMWNFYLKIYQYDQSYLTKIEEKSKKLIELSPKNLVAQETMIRTAIVKKDLEEVKKWTDIWKDDHPYLESIDKNYWDSSIEKLENELN